MVEVLIMSAKFGTLGFLAIKVFCNKGYDVINPVCDHVTQIVL